jgi:hypothetical protein
MLGLKSKVTGTPILKPTIFYTNARSVVEAFKPFQCDGSHHHVAVQGSEGGVKRSVWSQKYPRKLCEVLAGAVRDLLPL